MIDYEIESRFEYLSGRFFDGDLSDREDQEFVALLNSEKILARRFLEHARIERVVGYALNEESRLSEAEFIQAMERTIAIDDPVESERFAQNVVKLVREGISTHSNRRISLRGRRRAPRNSFGPLTVGIACAAALALALLLALSGGPTTSSVASSDPVRIESINLTLPKTEIASTPETNTFTLPTENVRREILPQDRAIDVAAVPPPLPDENVARTDPLTARKPTAVAETKPEIAKTTLPPPQTFTSETATAVATNATTPALAVVARVTNVKVLKVRSGTKEEKPVLARGTFSNGDMLRVRALDVSANEMPAGPRNVDLVMADGSQITLNEGSEFVVAAEGAAPRPILERGELLARIKPQTPGSNLIIKTRQGAEAAVLGTVFTLKADPATRRVELRVDEGKVQFSNKGEKRIVTADEACVVEDGKIPSQPYALRLKPATLTGIVTDKETGRPIPNATVSVAPYAERQKHLPRMGAKTDLQGRYVIPNVREGFAFVLAKTDEGGAAGLKGRGSIVRTRLTGGEKNTLNLVIDTGALAVGKLTENGKPVPGAIVRLVPQGSDGQSMELQLTMNGGSQADWAAVGLEGAGKYLAIVDKPGFIARIKNTRMNDLRSHLVANWPIDVQLVPSAIIKGRVTNTAGVAITDPEGVNPLDPRMPRTIVTLASPSGTVWSAEAEADGTFTFDTNLETAVYDFKIERFGFAPFIKRLNLSAGQTLELPVALELAKLAPH